MAKVQKKEKAVEIYEKAKREKKTAVLLTEARPDIFQLRLGSLSPGAECIVTVTIVAQHHPSPSIIHHHQSITIYQHP